MENLFDAYTSAEKELLLDEQEIVNNEFAEEEGFEDTVARYYSPHVQCESNAYEEQEAEWMLNEMKNDPSYGYY